MRVVIFDGILETHVASSLERSFIKRGHEVFNTGKIGHGFKFPAPGENIAHLEVAVHQTIAFAPDLVFVMRPCSLPPHLIKKIRRANSNTALAAWFSDDPVLFDLSYAPIVNLYDFIFHCGNQKVLQFYEDMFGRSTGVNLPFWTDHEAFPYIWGAEEPKTDFLFLGNVHDKVRRGRYFELGELKQSVRIHGNVGSDYFGLSGSYLDSDSEVVGSCASAKMALNIPQFFENHRGLDTWFEGLGKLGFFEYPSRVIQYMAMGLPTISVIQGRPQFRSYPEMFVANDINEAGELFEACEPNLESISQLVVARFDKHFSADCRVLAIESAIASSDWKDLDASEREIWFTQFDGQKASTTPSKPNVLAPCAKDRILVKEKSLPRGDKKVLICGHFESEGYWSRSRALSSLLGQFVNVEELCLDSHPELLVPDPNYVCKYAINISKIDQLKHLGDAEIPFDAIFVVGEDISITNAACKYLKDRNITSILVDDSSPLIVEKQIPQLAGFDLVAYGNQATWQQITQNGFTEAVFLPIFPDEQYIASVLSDTPNSDIVHLRENSRSEESTAPCYVYDFASGAPKSTIDYADLYAMSPEAVRESLNSEVVIASLKGNRNYPKPSQVAVNAAASSVYSFVPRCADESRLYPLNKLSIMVQKTGELATKVSLYNSSPQMARNYLTEKRQAMLELAQLSEDSMRAILDKCFNAKATKSMEIRKGFVHRVDLDFTNQTLESQCVVVNLACKYLYGSPKDWWLRIRLDGKAIFGERILTSDRRYLVKSPSVINEKSLSIELEYTGTDRHVSATAAFDITAVADPKLFDGIRSGQQVMVLL
jgi:hypothetical protein